LAQNNKLGKIRQEAFVDAGLLHGRTEDNRVKAVRTVGSVSNLVPLECRSKNFTGNTDLSHFKLADSNISNFENANKFDIII
jgi:hypothetical protein